MIIKDAEPLALTTDASYKGKQVMSIDIAKEHWYGMLKVTHDEKTDELNTRDMRRIAKRFRKIYTEGIK